MDLVKRKLVFSFISFLNEEIASAGLPESSVESLEVVTQCLESVYNFSSTNPEDRKALYTTPPLAVLFEEHATAAPFSKQFAEKPEPSPEEKIQAEELKNQGNDLMKCECFSDAIDKYNQAINLHPSNAVYYCNRAAAHSKMNNHGKAVEDCLMATELDPNYGKAYGRLGLAYASMEDYQNASLAYQKALELDPANESYKNNLSMANEKVAAGPGPTRPTLGGFDLGSLAGSGGLSNLLSDPNFTNMATRMMSNPEVVNAFSNMMQGGTMPVGQGAGFEQLLQMGQQIAQQIEQQDPQRVEQLRQQFQASQTSRTEQPPAPGNGNQPPM